MAGGAQTGSGAGGETEDNEVLHHSSERFRMKLIRDFRLLENLTEMEAGLEAPKYHAQDVQDEKKRMKLLTDNPNALVKFHNVTPRADNPKYEHLNETQCKRLHKIKYRLARGWPPRDYIANNIVESKRFKRMINCIIYINLFTVLFQTSIVTEYKRLSKGESEPVPIDTSYYFFDDDKYPITTSAHFGYFQADDPDKKFTFDQGDCSITYEDGEFVNITGDSLTFHNCTKSVTQGTWMDTLWFFNDWNGPIKKECEPFFERFRYDIMYDKINNLLFGFEIFIMVVFILEVLLYWIDDFNAYWRSGTRIFDFIVTILCILPIIFDWYMENHLNNEMTFISEEIKNFKNYTCPYVQWNNILIDMSERIDHKENDVLLFTIINQIRRENRQFIGSTRELFCNVMDQAGGPGLSTIKYYYFCNVSSTKKISSMAIPFSYQWFLALRVCRIFKITFGDPKVRAIVVSIRKAFKSMMVIFFLMLMMILLFSLFIYTMFNDTGEAESGIEYTNQNLISMFTDKKLEERNGFGGFISFEWTFSILCQLMTLDRWKGVIDQVFYDTYNETQFCELHTWSNVGGWMFPPPDGNRESGKFLTWILIFLFLWLWVYAGNFVFKNLITGIVVNNFLAYSNEVRWGENEANVERELKNIADEIEEEVKRVELVPGTTMTVGMLSNESIISDDESDDLDMTLIEQYEKQADFWRENYYKPWRYPFVTRLFPNLSTKIEQLTYRINRLSVRDTHADNDELGMSDAGSADTLDLLDKAIRRSSFKSATPTGSQNLRPDDENMRRISTHMLENHGLNVNTPNTNMRRGSCLSVANEINMNSIARNLHNLRTNNLGGSIDSIDSSSDSESDIEDNEKNSRRMADRRKSTQSLLSSYSHRYTTTNNRKNSRVVNENDTAEFDMTQWELAIQMHMDKVKGFPKESLWPRDVLFKYYQLMERIQENLQERQEIIRLFSQCMLNDHDI